MTEKERENWYACVVRRYAAALAADEVIPFRVVEPPAGGSPALDPDAPGPDDPHPAAPADPTRGDR